MFLTTKRTFKQETNFHGLEHFWSAMQSCFFDNIKDAWNCNQTLFELKKALMQFFLISCIQSGQREKASVFLAKHALPRTAWQNWFTLPYLSSPEKTAYFAMYFSADWEVTLFASLVNAFSNIFRNISCPKILLYNLCKMQNLKLSALLKSTLSNYTRLKEEQVKMPLLINKHLDINSDTTTKTYESHGAQNLNCLNSPVSSNSSRTLMSKKSAVFSSTHEGPVSCCKLSPDLTLVASGGQVILIC